MDSMKLEARKNSLIRLNTLKHNDFAWTTFESNSFFYLEIHIPISNCFKICPLNRPLSITRVFLIFYFFYNKDKRSRNI